MFSGDMGKPLVSVIIPVYNAERFVAAAVQSVLDQSYENVDCVVIDDGSTDSSLDILRSFGDTIQVVSTINRGVADARNRGISEASGELIAFLDADDVWLPEKLNRQVALFAESPNLGLVYCAMQVVDERLHPMRDMPCPPALTALRNTLLMEPPVVAISQTGLVPARILDSVGGFDDRLSTSADTDLVIRIAKDNQVMGIDEPLVLYRQHPAQMHSNLEAMEHDMLLVFEKLFHDPLYPYDVRSLRDRAFANLHSTLAAGYWERRDLQATAIHSARSLWHHPLPLIRGSGRRLLRVGRCLRGSSIS